MDARSGPTVVPLPLLSPGLPGWRGFPQLSCSMQHNSNNLIAGRHETGLRKGSYKQPGAERACPRVPSTDQDTQALSKATKVHMQTHPSHLYGLPCSYLHAPPGNCTGCLQVCRKHLCPHEVAPTTPTELEHNPSHTG
eukprot:1157380-Pelagomonas_calceolata.AAC.11